MSTWVLLAAVIIGFNAVSLAAILCVYLLYPHYIILFIFWVQGYIAGLKTKYVSDGQVTFCYGEKNKPRPDKPSLVFIHGFTANKESWSQSIKLLPKDLHIIAVDLLGHGHSSVPGEEVELSMDYMMDTFHRFLELAGLSSVKVHLIGISLGGNIAGHYAVRHPDTVAKVTMICPAMFTPVDSELARGLKEKLAKGVENLTLDDSKLLAHDVDGLKELFQTLCYNKSAFLINKQFLVGLLTLRQPRLNFFLRLYRSSSLHFLPSLSNVAANITPPSQVIWGKQDSIIDVSGAEYLKAKLPDCRHVDIIDKCGHALNLEYPELFAKHILKFVMEDKDSSKKYD